MERLRIGQIGAGLWGNVMLGVWAEHPRVDLVAVADVDLDRARGTAERFGISAAVDDLDALLARDDIDAVGVATPDFAHREATVQALTAGKHVLVQKPMATTVADCRAMVEAEAASGKALMVDFQHRWGIGFAEARGVVVSGSLGRVVHGRISMSNTTRVPTEMLRWAGQSSCLWFLGTHTADLLRYVLGSEPVAVYAVSRRGVLEARGVTTPDFFQSTIEFANGACVQMENSWVLPQAHVGGIEMGMALYGEHECLHVNACPTNVIVRTRDDGADVPLGARGQIMARGRSINHFTDSLLADRKPSITGHDGLMNTATLIAIERSIAEHRRVELAEVLD